MHSGTASGNPRLLFWRRVREFAVPAPMIESATGRRAVGDWAGACAAARVDVDLNLRTVARIHGREFAAQLRADLRHLAPDLLRWHLPRVAPDGLLRPGLTVSLARYHAAGDANAVHLVARTPPAWADADQRISLALWDGSGDMASAHPHPRPDRRYRLDLHRHLWDARRAGELRERSGADRWPVGGDPPAEMDPALVGPDCGGAVHRWAAEAAILLRAEGRAGGAVAVRLGARRRLVLELGAAPGSAPLKVTAVTKGRVQAYPVLPDAATWVLPDLELLRAGLIDADWLHPLVAPALVPGHRSAGRPRAPDDVGRPRLVACRGRQHRIGLVDGVLTPLDHDATELHRENLLAALGGPPLPCLRAIDEATRHPECLPDIRARLDHGDATGALAAVAGVLGPGVVLRDGPLRDELESAVRRRITYGMFRAGLAGQGPPPEPSKTRRRGRDVRIRMRLAGHR